MSVAFLSCSTALGLSVIFYGYLLVHPVAKTRAFIRNNVKLFPIVVVLMLSGVILVGFAICIRTSTMFGDLAGALVSVVGFAGLLFFLAVFAYLEYNTYCELVKYRLRRARKWVDVPVDPQL